MQKMLEKNQDEALSAILNNLMESRGLRASELAREVKMPESTIRYLLYGTIKKPSAEKLKKLADFFGVSMEYLMGQGELPLNDDSGKNKEGCRFLRIPVFTFGDVKLWSNNQKKFDEDKIIRWIAGEEAMSLDSFGVFIDRGIKGLFLEDSVLVVDVGADCQPGEYVVASIAKKKPSLYRLWENEGEFFLEPVGFNLPMELKGSQDVIFGKVIEFRRYL